MSNQTEAPQTEAPRMAIPDLDGPSVVFGDIKHMPAYSTLPAEFQDYHYNPHCEAVHAWFFGGAARDGDAITFDKHGEVLRYVPREGVDANKALRAIKAVLGSFSPKHEHKIAACGYMLDQWFERAELAKPTQASV